MTTKLPRLAEFVRAPAFGRCVSFRRCATLRAEDDCQKRITKADHKLHEAVEHHGWESPQAEHGA